MLHEAIFLATCLATMTNEKHFKLQRGCHTFAIFFRNLQGPPPPPLPGKCLQLFLRQLEISWEQKTGSDCLIFTKLRCRLRWTSHTQQLVSQRCEKLRIFLLFLQLAKQHFVAVAGCKTGVLHVKSFLQFVSQCLLRDKLQEKFPRVTWPLVGASSPSLVPARLASLDDLLPPYSPLRRFVASENSRSLSRFSLTNRPSACCAG